MKNLFASFIRDDKGQDIIEYALLAAFISIVAYTLLGQMRDRRQTPVRRHGDDRGVDMGTVRGKNGTARSTPDDIGEPNRREAA